LALLKTPSSFLPDALNEVGFDDPYKIAANVMALPSIGDSLAGRIEIIQFFPLSQAELTLPPVFIQR
jgi:hypothetical protein